MHTKFGSGPPPLSMTEADGKGKGKRLGSQARDGEAAYLKHKIQFGEHLTVFWPLGVSATTFGPPHMHGCWSQHIDLAASEGVQLIIRGRDNRDKNKRIKDKNMPDMVGCCSVLRILGPAGHTRYWYTKLREQMGKQRGSLEGLPHPSAIKIGEIVNGECQAPDTASALDAETMQEPVLNEGQMFPTDAVVQGTDVQMQEAMAFTSCGEILGPSIKTQKMKTSFCR